MSLKTLSRMSDDMEDKEAGMSNTKQTWFV